MKFTAEEKRHNQRLQGLPGDQGAFLLGHLPQFGKLGAFKFGMQRFREHGPVFRYRLLNQNFVGMVGPEANQLVFRDQQQNFSVRLGYAFIGELNVGSLLGTDFDSHLRDRRFIQHAFKREAMQDHLQKMNPRIREALQGWEPASNFKFLPQIKSVILNIAATSFMGRPLDEHTQRLNQLLDTNMAGLVTPLKFPIPFGTYSRALTAGNRLQQFLRDMIPAKRQEASNDMFCLVSKAQNEDGSYQFSEDEVVAHMHLMMAGGYDTTISILSTLVCLLAKYPEWQDRVRQECLDLSTDELEFDDLGKLPSLDMFYNETLRMLPTPPMPRRALREFEFNGQTIPANSQIHLYTNVVHFLPDLWDNPETFDPERFSAERAEHKRKTMQFAPFGGGAHACIGMHFSTMQVKTFFFHLLRHYRLSAPPESQITYVFQPNPRPSASFPLTISALA